MAEQEICENFAKSYKSARLEDEVVALRDTFGPNKLQPNLKSFRSLVLDSVLTPLVFFEGLCLALVLLNGQTLVLRLPPQNVRLCALHEHPREVQRRDQAAGKHQLR